MSSLVDSHGRRFVYLRLSVTDKCNFRCSYCLPNGYVPSKSLNQPELSLDEIRRLVSGFGQLGFTKVRLTGGEPTLRRDIVQIAEVISSVIGLQKIAITTNGYRLLELAAPLRIAGVTAINVSVDSLDRETFKNITGTDRLERVLAGIDEAARVGFESIKVNAVLLKDTGAEDIGQFMDWVKRRPVSVRFIELMRTGTNEDYFSKQHVSAGNVQLKLLKAGWLQTSRRTDDGPAVVFKHPHYAGSIGIIAPYSSEFCQTCNRLRVSARGAMKLCLFGDRDESLRPYLQDDKDIGALTDRIQYLLTEKPVSHRLQEGIYGNTPNLASIGG
jgi:cyclic pyranopterin phosphate synthase